MKKRNQILAGVLAVLLEYHLLECMGKRFMMWKMLPTQML